MGRSYYYLSASLPTLVFNQRPPLSLETFLAECQRLMAPQDYLRILRALADEEAQEPAGNDTYGRWAVFDRDFRNESAYFRAVRAGKDPQKHLRGQRKADHRLTDVLTRASQAVDPLSAERILDAFRFEFLEQLAADQFMNFDYLLTYGLKLKMMVRYDRIGSTSRYEVLKPFKEVELQFD